MMKSRLIVSLIFAFLLALFAVFNQHPAKVILLGYHVSAGSLAIVVFFAFLAGTVYCSILGILGGIKLRGVITAQKRQLKDLCSQQEGKAKNPGFTED